MVLDPLLLVREIGLVHDVEGLRGSLRGWFRETQFTSAQ